MDSHRLVAQLKIESAQNRARALIEEVSRIKNRSFSSPASKDILEFVQEAATAISSLLELEKKVADGSPLKPPELEVRLHRTIKVIPYLHTLIGFIEGSEIPKSPGQLIQPLRRYVRSVIKNSDIVVSSKPELNYSIREVVASIRKAFSETPPLLANSCAKLPEFLFLVNIPAIESEQILIHAILSHELGHALYNKHDLGKRLLPAAIEIRHDMIKHLVKIVTTGETESLPMSEIFFRQYVTDQVTERVSRWVAELSSDAIGIQLFGPALYFASTTLFSSFSHMDRCSSSHPPPRLRIKLMTGMLKKAYQVDKWHSELKKLIKAWDEISGETITIKQQVDQIAIESLDKSEVLDLIETAVGDAIPEHLRYHSKQLDADIRDLVPLILNSVPPGELG